MICHLCGADISTDLLHALKCGGDVFPIASRVRSTDPETSFLAALGVHQPTDRVRALTALRRAGMDGLTDFELAAEIGRQQTSAGKRRGELCTLGLVRDSGRRRPAPSGSLAIVWRITTDEERHYGPA